MMTQKLICIILCVSVLLIYPISPSPGLLLNSDDNRLISSPLRNIKKSAYTIAMNALKSPPRSNKREEQNEKESEGTESAITDPSGSNCGDWQHFCISIDGLLETGNPGINDNYCIYECDVNNYIKFQSQTDCSFFIKWIPNH
eukprot:291217_1